MRKVWLLLLATGFSILLWAQTAPLPTVDIPYQKFTLDNGLTLIVHEDHKAPIVAVNIWYHVGSKNEVPGRTGFAHLFEHLMFNGSENFNQDYFKALESIGGTDLNGTTNEDRTNYFQNVPVSALDQVLFLESDRMGHFAGAIDQARLDEQRGVVQNEKRQGENQPYALAWEQTAKNTYPAGHPYSWTVIGSMEDLSAASLDDVKKWFQTYYGPNNAVLVLAGDITPDVALEKVKKYFGHIPAGPPIKKQETWIARMEGQHRLTAQDRVPQTRVQKTWNVSPWGTPDAAYLTLLSHLLSEGKSSRLYNRLVYKDELVSNVYTYLDNREIGGQFYIQTDLKPGVDAARVEKIIDEELRKLMSTGVTDAELSRARMTYFANFVKGLERIGGFGGKSDILAQSAVYGGSPDAYKKNLEFIRKATPADIKRTAAAWLSDGDFVLTIHPFPEYKVGTAAVDRKAGLPALGPEPAVAFNKVENFTLSNGLKVVLAPRSGTPVVSMRLLLDGGYASDPAGKTGLVKMAMKMLKEGTATRSALQLSDELSALGASLNTYSALDNNTVSMKALKPNLDKSLDLFTDVVLRPIFPQKDFNRVKNEQLLEIKQEEVQPIAIGLRVLPRLLYGEGH
ncbi:MAG TPA: insulinase family protein, partial [Chitinophagaceae bacterium]